MKRNFILTVSSVLALLSGCGVQEDDFTPGKETVLTVLLEEPDTRVSIDGTYPDGKLTWDEDDEIAIYVTGTGYKKATVTETSTDVIGKIDFSEADFLARDFYAVYPYRAAVAVDYGNPDLVVNLPVNYEVSPYNDFSETPMVAVNDPAQSILQFRHIGGLLRITCEGLMAGTKTIRVTLDKPVTGLFTVNSPASDSPTITTYSAAGSNSNTVVFTVPSTIDLTGTVVLNVPVPCGSYGSVTLVACDSGGNTLTEAQSTEPHTFLRRHGWKVPSFDSLSFEFICEGLTAVSANYSGGNQSLASAFKSYKQKGSTTVKVPFQFQHSTDGGTTWVDGLPVWLDDGGIDHSGSVTGQALTLSMAPQTMKTIDLRRRTLLANGEYTTAKDLSTINVATGATVSRTTANCYVIDRPGKYKFPVVYGNGVQGGTAVASAYTGQNATNYLNKFKGHNDADISSPYIATNLNTDAITAELLWTDVPNLVDPEKVSVSGTGSSMYINFEVPAATISEGNAVIAAVQNNTVVWSWHIWVTATNLKDLKAGSNDYQFAPVAIGWVHFPSWGYEGRSCQVRAVQTESGLSSNAVTVSQTESITTNNRGTAVYYEWGRKDPFLGAVTDNNFTMRLMYFYHRQPANLTAPGRVSIGTSIKNPCVYYTYDNAVSDWCSTTYYNTWNTNFKSMPTSNVGEGYYRTTVTKTIYDPSPVGFKLPPEYAFNGFTTSNFTWNDATSTKNAGRTSTSGLFVPVLGYRNPRTYDGSTEGYSLAANTTGCSWAATPTAAGTAWDLTFTSSAVNLSTTSNWRLDGKPIFPIVGDK